MNIVTVVLHVDGEPDDVHNLIGRIQGSLLTQVDTESEEGVTLRSARVYVL